jgi:ketosteroid isomerase-like protein
LPEVRSALEQVYVDASQAFIDKDLGKIEGFTAEDFTADDGKAKKNREQFLEGIRNQFETMDVVSWDRSIISVKHQGDLVLVVNEGDFVAKKQDGSEVRMSMVNEDAWEKQNGKWMIKWARSIG